MSTDQEPAALDRDVRFFIYDQTMKTGRPPPLAEIAALCANGSLHSRASAGSAASSCPGWHSASCSS